MKPLILIDRHEGIHEFLQLQHAVTATHAAYLIILLYAIRLNSRVIDDERHRLLYVGTNLYRSRMVGRTAMHTGSSQVLTSSKIDLMSR